MKRVPHPPGRDMVFVSRRRQFIDVLLAVVLFTLIMGATFWWAMRHQ